MQLVKQDSYYVYNGTLWCVGTAIVAVEMPHCVLCILFCYMCYFQWYKNIEFVVTVSSKVLKMLPWKCSIQFPLYYWAACYCQQLVAV